MVPASFQGDRFVVMSATLSIGISSLEDGNDHTPTRVDMELQLITGLTVYKVRHTQPFIKSKYFL